MSGLTSNPKKLGRRVYPGHPFFQPFSFEALVSSTYPDNDNQNSIQYPSHTVPPNHTHICIICNVNLMFLCLQPINDLGNFHQKIPHPTWPRKHKNCVFRHQKPFMFFTRGWNRCSLGIFQTIPENIGMRLWHGKLPTGMLHCRMADMAGKAGPWMKM